MMKIKYKWTRVDGFALVNQNEPAHIKKLKECYVFYLNGFEAQG